MKSKKTCQCGRPVYAKEMCGICYRKSKPAKPRKPIRPYSQRRHSENAEYGKLRMVFLGEYPSCQAKLPGCSNVSTDIHHKARRGKFLLRVDTWLACCRECHVQIENNGTMAREKGFLLTQEQIRKLS